jgi:hypothetical protein
MWSGKELNNKLALSGSDDGISVAEYSEAAGKRNKEQISKECEGLEEPGEERQTIDFLPSSPSSFSSSALERPITRARQNVRQRLRPFVST